MFNLLELFKITLFSIVFFLIAACSHYGSQDDNQPVVSQDAAVAKPLQSNEVVTITGSRLNYVSRKAMPAAAKYQPISREKYQRFESNQVVRVSDNPVSTFSIDVDTGSYTNMRRFINSGSLPVADGIRLEELVNYFDYQYPSPKNDEEPFSIHSSMIDTPWSKDSKLLKVALQGWRQQVDDIPPMNLVFLIDVSGSMHSEEKLPLVIRSLTMLTQHLDADDRIAIVSYAGQSRVVLESTPGNQKSTIRQALSKLTASGSTNGASGIELAYQIAQENFIKAGVNRVLLATDGDFNVGISDHDALVDLIQEKKKSGVFLNTLGFGTGNYNDHLMEQLANKGNGTYAYIDAIFEAKRVLVDEIAATMQTIAKDVKIQIEFNPQVVHEYRLIGYENRKLNEEDFNNDKVDAGEIGAGHSVTALYEVTLKTSPSKRLSKRRYQVSQSKDAALSNKEVLSELAYVKFRYKLPQSDKSKLLSKVLNMDELLKIGESDSGLHFAAAVAGFGQLLRDDRYLNDYQFSDLIALANEHRQFDPNGRKAEFVQLIQKAEILNAEREQ